LIIVQYITITTNFAVVFHVDFAGCDFTTLVLYQKFDILLKK